MSATVFTMKGLKNMKGGLLCRALSSAPKGRRHRKARSGRHARRYRGENGKCSGPVTTTALGGRTGQVGEVKNHDCAGLASCQNG